MKNANSVAVFCDGSTDSVVIEKECIYILFVEPFRFEPTVCFIALKDVLSQDTDGIKSAIMKAFDGIGMSELKDRMAFLATTLMSTVGSKQGSQPNFKRMVLTGLCLSGVCLID